MLTISVPGFETFNNEKQEFVYSSETILRMEHSLISLSKWESKWEKPFLGKEEKTPEEVFSYIKLMCLDEQVPEDVFQRLSQENMDAINEYIGQKMTATWFNDTTARPPSREIVTSELIYHWMIAMNIPSEYETWHLNRLTTLIKVINLKNAPKKKMSPAEIAKRNHELNEQRRKQLGTSG